MTASKIERIQLAPEGRVRTHLHASLAYLMFLAATLAVFWPTVAELIRQWSGSSSFRHGFAVAPIAFWLCIRRQPESEPRPAPFALAFVGGAALLWSFGRELGANIVEEVALVLALISGAALTFGFDFVRRRAFAFAFLFFMAPAGVSLAPFLQAIAASVASALLHLAGITHERTGLVITTSSGGFEVAAGCAGLNFLLASLMISSLFVHLRGMRWRSGAAFIAASAGVALAANAVRVFAVIAIATMTDGSTRIAADHLAFSLAVYGAFVLLLISAGMRITPGADDAERRDRVIARLARARVAACAERI